MTRRVTCPACRGVGHYSGWSAMHGHDQGADCGLCDGLGTVTPAQVAEYRAAEAQGRLYSVTMGWVTVPDPDTEGVTDA